MHSLLQDLRYGIRVLGKAPGFTAVAILAMALGIGANSTMFSALKGAVLRPFSFPQVSRLVNVYSTRPAQGPWHMSPSDGDFTDFERESRSFENLAAFQGWAVNLTGEGEPERLEGYQVSNSFFRLLGLPPMLGRTLTANDAVPGSVRAVVISYTLWKQRFNSDARLVGKSVMLDGQEVAIAGVMPEDFDFPMGAQVWAPFSWTDAERQDRGTHHLDVIGRLRDGVTLEQAQAELNTIAGRLEKQYPTDDAGQRVELRGTVEEYTNGSRQFISVLMGAACFVLLLACANVANLQLARATVRAREMAVRSALGASRLRLVRQLLMENILLGAGGGLAGIVVGAIGIRLTMRRVPPFILAHAAGLRNIQLDTGVVIFTATMALLTGLIAGIVPALAASRTNMNEGLKESGRGAEGRGRHRSRALLVSTEVALALVLLVGAGLMVEGFRALSYAEMGFDTHNILTFSLRLPNSSYATDAQRWTFYHDALERIRHIPGVQADSVATMLPGGWSFMRTPVRAEDAPTIRVNELPTAITNRVAPAYLSTMKMRLLSGRNFRESDAAGTPPVAIINSQLAQKLWPGRDPLGRHIRLGRDDSAPWRTVVGVIADARTSPFNQFDPIVMTAFAQEPVSNAAVVVRTSGDPMSTVGAIRDQLRYVDAAIPMYDVRTQDQLISDNLSGIHTSADLMSAFALTALILAAAGVFAVMAYSVRQRRREIGVRMALGARRDDVLKLILRSSLRITAAGLAIGLAASIALSKLLTSFLLGVIHMNLIAILAFTTVMMVVAVSAALLPAHWASRVDPMIALRCE